MTELYRAFDYWKRSDCRDAFERVLQRWEELEQKGPLGIVGIEKEIALHFEGEPIPGLGVLVLFEDCHEPLPDHLQNKRTRYVSFEGCNTYADLAKFLAAVVIAQSVILELELRAAELPEGAKLN